MPSRRCLEPHELVALGDAFEFACQELGNTDLEDSKRSRLAKSILMLINRGEVHLEPLVRRAVLHFRNTQPVRR